MNSVDDKVVRFVRLTWTAIDGSNVPTFRNHEGQLLYPFNEYLDELGALLTSRRVKSKAARSKIKSTSYNLLAFANYIASRAIALEEVDDIILENFRDSELDAVKANPISRGIESKCQITVNVKLRDIYQFLFKCQKAHRIPAGTIGWINCKVRSSLPLQDERPSDTNNQENRKHPLCYAGVGESSREDGSQYWATNADISQLEEVFWHQHDNLYISQRNNLLLRIGEQMGWRHSSTNSLEVEQFSDSRFEAQEQLDDFVVVPPYQKGKHIFHYRMRFELAHQIRRFIAGPRQELVARLGIGEEVSQGRIFLSGTKGTPLADQSVCEIFSDAFKQIKRPKGASGHALRRYRAEATAGDEVEYRRANGLSLVEKDVTLAVQDVLGHANELSQRAYRRSITKLRGKSRAEALERRILELLSVIDGLQEKNELLSTQISQLTTKLTSQRGKKSSKGKA